VPRHIIFASDLCYTQKNKLKQAIEKTNHTDSTGLAISGGGTRAFAFSTGILRGMKALFGPGNLPKHVVGASGGGWAIMVSKYAKDDDEVRVNTMIEKLIDYYNLLLIINISSFTEIRT
jgi:predicted acylesterase/phospholipase RssA